MVFSVAGTVALLVLAIYHHATLGQLMATLVYGASLTAVYVASTFSHAIQHPRRKQFFRVLDQAVIYCLIAGTYTPFILTYMPAQRKWAVLAFVWALAAVGFLSKAFLKHRIEAVVVANYILLGWLPAMAMISLMPLDCMLWMACGGVLYTVGTLFLTFDQRVPFFHATWQHLCSVPAPATSLPSCTTRFSNHRVDVRVVSSKTGISSSRSSKPVKTCRSFMVFSVFEHAVGDLIHLAGHVGRFLSVDGHFGQRRDLVFQPIDFQLDEFVIRLRAIVVAQAILAGGQVVCERAADLLGLRGRVLGIECRDSLFDPLDILRDAIPRGASRETAEACCR